MLRAQPTTERVYLGIAIQNFRRWLTIGQAITKWEERSVATGPASGVIDVDRQLLMGARPGIGRIADERMVTEQNIRDARTFRSWKPGSDPGLRQRQLFCDHARTARQKYN